MLTFKLSYLYRSSCLCMSMSRMKQKVLKEHMLYRHYMHWEMRSKVEACAFGHVTGNIHVVYLQMLGGCVVRV